MRQLLATLALVAATTAAPLATLCEWRCAREPHPAKAAPHCHEVEAGAPTGGSVVADAEQCGGHDSAPALVEARRSQARAAIAIASPLPIATLSLHAAPESSPAPLSPPDTSPPRFRKSILRV